MLRHLCAAALALGFATAAQAAVVFTVNGNITEERDSLFNLVPVISLTSTPAGGAFYHVTGTFSISGLAAGEDLFTVGLGRTFTNHGTNTASTHASFDNTSYTPNNPTLTGMTKTASGVPPTFNASAFNINSDNNTNTLLAVNANVASSTQIGEGATQSAQATLGLGNPPQYGDWFIFWDGVANAPADYRVVAGPGSWLETFTGNATNNNTDGTHSDETSNATLQFNATVLGLPEAGTDGHTFVFGQIPEPTSLGLFGFAGLVLARRRR